VSFESPALLVGLLLVPLALLGYLALERRSSRYGVRFTNLDVLASVVEERRPWGRHLPAALLLAAVAALLIALARPTVTVAAPQERATVVLLVDVSGSMRAEDVAPTRLEAARAAMHTFLDKVPKEIRVAVVAFSDGPEVVVPPTADRNLARAGIDLLAPGFGTALGDGLARAAELAAGVGEEGALGKAPVDADGKSLAAVLLLSDGKQTRGELTPDEGAAKAKEARVPVYAIALGTDTGTIEVFRFGQTQTVSVPPDRETLRQVAAETGGEYFDAPDAERLTAVYQRLGSRVGRAREEREVSVAFVAAGALLALGAIGIATLRAPRLP
jgi:Ca-activated chloride channel family protein